MKKVHNYLVIAFLVAVTLQTTQAQKKYEAPKLSNPNSWTLILVPDTQNYVKYQRNQGTLDLMTAWISENIDPLNIKMVLCTGDLVEQNDMIVPDGKNGNQTSREQWLAVSRMFGRLDGQVPYVLAAGNHDYGYKGVEHRGSNYNTYFPAHKNQANYKLLSAAAKNAGGHPSLENSAFDFTAPDGRKFLFMTLEFAPRDTIVQWAKDVVDDKKYKEHTVALLTHSYLNSKNERIKNENYPIKDGNYGEAVWQKLVAPSKNIQLVFSGHIGGADNFKAHVGFKEDKNKAGKKVSQMAFNAQAMGGGWQGNGGDGWLRILEFLPDGKTVQVHTFSPLFAASPATKHLAWSTETFNDFSFSLD